MKTTQHLLIDGIVMRERDDQTDKNGNPVTFPTVVVSGITLRTSESGHQSFSKRRVSIPLNGMTEEEAVAALPIIQEYLKDRRIEPYQVEPYEWITPDGEIRTDTVRYRLVEIETPTDDSGADEGATPDAPEKHIFSGMNRKNDLQPQV